MMRAALTSAWVLASCGPHVGADMESSSTGASFGASETGGGTTSVADPPSRDRLVFVTSTEVQGDFGGQPGIDDLCNQLAAEAGLLVGNRKRFRAWVSTTDVAAADRFQHSTGRYVLTTGDVVALNWAGLTSGLLLHPIDADERGNIKRDVVWTGTTPAGQSVEEGNCNDWTSASDILSTVVGYSTEIDEQWTQTADGSSPAACSDIASLYCLEFR